MNNSPRKSVTSFDVAQHAGVSRSMVSRAFTKGSNITEKSRKKVLKAAEELGYRVNYLARGLQTRQSNLVGIVVSDLDTPFRSKQVKLIVNKLIQHGYRPILLTAETSDEVEHLVTLLFNYNVAGVLITSATPSSKIIAECHHLSMPIALINRDNNHENADTVQIDIEQAGALAFFMLTKSGARNLAVVQPQKSSYSVTGRVRVFIDKCRTENTTVLDFTAKDQSYNAGHNIAGIIGLSLKQIDGIFCATDLLALGVMDRLRADWNVNIPRDLQVIGCDDIEQASWSSYNLSTMQQDVEVQALTAVQQMLNRIHAPKSPAQHYCQKLVPIFRQTTKSRHD